MKKITLALVALSTTFSLIAQLKKDTLQQFPAGTKVVGSSLQNRITGDELLGLKSGADPAKANASMAGRTRKKGRPVLFTIGDSTVKNGKGDGSNGQWGWGNFLSQFFDTTKVSVENHALGGRSSRTFLTEGLFDKVLNAVQPGDYVLIQFGHNDNGSPNTGRARASLKGISDSSQVFVMEATGKEVSVHTFGWYLRQYCIDLKQKKATPILVSLIPRNNWVTKDSLNIVRNNTSYALWTKQIAEQEKVPFIDLNEVIATKYEKLGKDAVQKLFYGDHTHTSRDGAILNAKTVAEEIKKLKKCKLRKAVKKKL